MHEGMFSLMQMAKTSAALSRHAAARLPFISVLTHPTMGGVTASFATLGDLVVAEPKAMIGFAGARVLKQTTRQDLPKDFQTAEFLLERGLVDRIIPRAQLRSELSKILDYFGDPLRLGGRAQWSRLPTRPERRRSDDLVDMPRGRAPHLTSAPEDVTGKTGRIKPGVP